MSEKVLMVGINRYPGCPLSGCVNDVTDMANLLVDQYGFVSSSIKLLTDERATTQAILDQLKWLVQGAKAGDRLLFHYSGHGAQVAALKSEHVAGMDDVICPQDFDWSESRLIRDVTFHQIFSALPEGVKFNWVADCCLAADTQISLLDGTEPTIKELAERGGEFWVYSSTPDGKVVPGRGHSARVTRLAEIMRVVLDNDEVVESTDDHPFMMRDGSYRAASELVAGDSLMPLYRRVGTEEEDNLYLKGYELIGDLDASKWVPTHRVVADAVGIRKNGKGHVVHHKNFNKRDNRPDNLEEMPWRDHKRAHGEVGRKNFKKTWAENEEYKAWRASDEYKKEQSERTLASWQNEEHRKNHLEGVKRRMERDGLPEKFLAYNFSDANRENSRRRQQPGGDLYEIVRSPENAERFRKMRNNPEFASKLDAAMKEQLKDPNSKLSQHRTKLRSPEHAERCRLMNQYANMVRWGKIDKAETPFAEWLKSQLVPNNHKVVRVERTGRIEAVYNMEVDDHHNFAVKAGVFVHNCHSGSLDRDLVPPNLKLPPNKRPKILASRCMTPPADIAWNHHRVAKDAGHVSRNIHRTTVEKALPVGFVSGCRDRETSSDAAFGGRPNGALTYFLLKALKSAKDKPLTAVVDAVRADLKKNGYTQVPQIDGTRASVPFLA